MSDDESRHQELGERLDADIARVREEIQNLTQRKRLLTSSLLSSTRLQSHIQKRHNTSLDDLPTDLNPLQAQAQHNETNIHRLAYGVTSFPFTDPNPDTSSKPLLGVRFDIPTRNGQFEKAPYYIFLKRANDTNHDDTATPTSSRDNDLQIHHHTIPALVPLQDYEAKYLPHTATNGSSGGVQGRDEGYFSPSPGNDQTEHNGDIDARRTRRSIGSTLTSTRNDVNPKQDLHALVAAVRHDLTSWQLRNDAISLLAEQLNVSDGGTSSDNDNTNTTARFLLQSIGATALDARFCRLVWQDGTVGRLRLTDDGYIDRAVVIGDVGDQGRMDRLKDVERMLCTKKDGSRLHIEKLVERLSQVEDRFNQTAKRRQSNSVGVDSMEVGSTNLDI